MNITGHRRYRKLRDTMRHQWQQADTPCWICRQPIAWNEHGTPDSFDLDHLHPVSTHPELALDPANWRPAHATCNRSRGNRQATTRHGATTEDW